MVRLLLFLLAVLAVAAGLAWLADRPGSLVVTWQDYVLETSVFRAAVIFTLLVGLAVLGWSIVRQIWSSPAAVSNFLTRRRKRRGLDALSSGMIAVGAGDRAMATRYAVQARKSLPNEPLTHLLRAQAAQLSGDKATARRIFEAMLGSPDTEQLGLRGLFLEAGRESEFEAQRQFAERALKLNPKLAWPVEALFNLECKAGDWAGALATLAAARRNGHIERAIADRRRAVLLTAQAQVLEEADPEKALTRSLEAHGLAPDLIPAAAIAGRLLAARGNTPRAAKVLQKTWSKAPHPELAQAYAYARIGDSPRDRLDRVKQLAALNPYSVESPIAVAIAAIEARQYDEARKTLAPYVENGLTRRMATLMARVEAEENGDKGRAREWLARAVNAGRDPAWTADGTVSERWSPISPVTGALDAFQWRVPFEEIDGGERQALDTGLEGLVALDRPSPASASERTPEVEPGSSPAPLAPKVIEAENVEQGRKSGHVEAAPAAAAASSSNTGAPKSPLPTPVTQTAPPRSPRKTGEPGAEHTHRGETRGADGPSRRPGASEGSKQPKSEQRGTGETRIFVPPHAPDDPGTELAESEDGLSPLPPFRAS